MSEMLKDLQSIYTAWGEDPPFDRPLIPFFRKKLAELGYVKVLTPVKCSRCGNYPHIYCIEYEDGDIGYACNCNYCYYGSLSGLPTIQRVIERWNEWNDQEQQDGWGDEGRARTRAEVAARRTKEGLIIPEGYVKVVRCGECVYRSSCECEVCTRHGNKRLCCHPNMGEDGIGYVPPEGYCHLGERVVAKNATGEEVPNGR